MVQLRENIDMKREKINELSPLCRNIVQQVEEAKKKITPFVMRKVYDYLDTKTAEPVAFLIESLVGLLRGQKRADCKTVQLYTYNHEGFMIRVNKLDLKTINPDHCKEVLDLLKKKYNAALNSVEFICFLPFRSLLVQFMCAGLILRDQDKLTQKLRKYEDKLELITKEIERINMVQKALAGIQAPLQNSLPI